MGEKGKRLLCVLIYVLHECSIRSETEVPSVFLPRSRGEFIPGLVVNLPPSPCGLTWSRNAESRIFTSPLSKPMVLLLSDMVAGDRREFPVWVDAGNTGTDFFALLPLAHRKASVFAWQANQEAYTHATSVVALNSEGLGGRVHIKQSNLWETDAVAFLLQHDCACVDYMRVGPLTAADLQSTVSGLHAVLTHCGTTVVATGLGAQLAVLRHALSAQSEYVELQLSEDVVVFVSRTIPEIHVFYEPIVHLHSLSTLFVATSYLFDPRNKESPLVRTALYFDDGTRVDMGVAGSVSVRTDAVGGVLMDVVTETEVGGLTLALMAVKVEVVDTTAPVGLAWLEATQPYDGVGKHSAVGYVPFSHRTELQEQFDKEGYTVLPDILLPEECDFLRDIALRIVDEKWRGDKESKTPIVAGVDLESEVIEAINWHPQVRDAVEFYLGPNRKFSSLAANVIHPNASHSGLHIDVPLPEFNFPLPTDVILCNTVWLLDDFTGTNGGTHVIPGSHTRRNSFPEPRAYPDEETAIMGRKGSVVLLNGAVWHGASANTSNRTRVALLSNWRRFDIQM